MTRLILLALSAILLFVNTNISAITLRKFRDVYIRKYSPGKRSQLIKAFRQLPQKMKIDATAMIKNQLHTTIQQLESQEKAAAKKRKIKKAPTKAKPKVVAKKKAKKVPKPPVKPVKKAPLKKPAVKASKPKPVSPKKAPVKVQKQTIQLPKPIAPKAPTVNVPKQPPKALVKVPIRARRPIPSKNLPENSRINKLKFEKQVQQVKNQVNTQKKIVERLKNELKDVNSSKIESDKSLENLKKVIRSESKDVMELDLNLSKAKAALENNKKQNEELRNTIADLQKQLKSTTLEKTDLRLQLIAAKDALKSSSHNINLKSKELERLRSRVLEIEKIVKKEDLFKISLKNLKKLVLQKIHEADLFIAELKSIKDPKEVKNINNLKDKLEEIKDYQNIYLDNLKELEKKIKKAQSNKEVSDTSARNYLKKLAELENSLKKDIDLKLIFQKIKALDAGNNLRRELIGISQKAIKLKRQAVSIKEKVGKKQYKSIEDIKQEIANIEKAYANIVKQTKKLKEFINLNSGNISDPNIVRQINEFSVSRFSPLPNLKEALESLLKSKLESELKPGFKKEENLREKPREKKDIKSDSIFDVNITNNSISFKIGDLMYSAALGDDEESKALNKVFAEKIEQLSSFNLNKLSDDILKLADNPAKIGYVLDVLIYIYDISSKKNNIKAIAKKLTDKLPESFTKKYQKQEFKVD